MRDVTATDQTAQTPDQVLDEALKALAERSDDVVLVSHDGDFLPQMTAGKGFIALAAVIILCREILVSGLREYLAELRVSVPVSRLAKWKTTWQLVAVGFLICGEAGDKVASDLMKHDILVITNVGLALLWLSALVTLYTGWDYMRAGLRHMID